MIDSKFYVEESYSWDNDIMKIANRIIEETDKARLSNVAEHFEVDLSEIREFLDMKSRKRKGFQTNADKIRAMSDEELANNISDYFFGCPPFILRPSDCTKNCSDCWLEWLKQEAEDGGNA